MNRSRKQEAVSLTRLSHLVCRAVSCQVGPGWDLVHVLGGRDLVQTLLRTLVDPRRSPGSRLLLGRCAATAGAGRLRLEHRPNQQLQAVAGGDALASVERAEPPALQTARVLLDDGQDVPLPEGQLFGGLGHVVVQSFGHQVLEGEQTGFESELHQQRVAAWLGVMGFPQRETPPLGVGGGGGGAPAEGPCLETTDFREGKSPRVNHAGVSDAFNVFSFPSCEAFKANRVSARISPFPFRLYSSKQMG